MGAYSAMLAHAVADRLGLNNTDWECLDVLDWAGPVTAGRLAELTGLTTGAITGVLDRLEQARFVRRARDPDDRRRVIVEQLPDRVAEMEELFTPMATRWATVLGRYDDDETALIVEFLKSSNSVLFQTITEMRAGTREVRPPHV